MFQKIPLWIGLLFLPLFLFGCVSTSMFVNKSAEHVQEESLIISPPDRIIADISQQPAHIKFIIAAMVNKMRGNRDYIPEVVFDSKGTHIFYDTNFTYDEFDLYLTQITGFKVKSQNNNKADLVVEGVFNFKDLFGRGAVNYFAADYTVHKKGITINKSATALIAPTIPDVEVFYVPKASFDSVNMKDLSSFMDLYIYAIQNAFNMEPTQEERKNKEKNDKLPVWKKIFAKNNIKVQECYIMAFCKDRLPPDASLEMKITRKPGMGGQTLFQTGYFYDNGWRVMLAGGEFSPDAVTNNFYVNLKYNTNSNPNSKSILLGSYTNQKNYNNNPQYIIKPKTKATNFQSQPNPIESGVVILNLMDKNDAKLIQTRLKALGYYTKKIDGSFGRGSKKALKDFRRDNGLGYTSTWDLKTQKILFKNSGL